MSTETIRVEGARQNNLKNLCLSLPTHRLIVVTGVSGSGKSSLAFDTLYAEGQRRYVETFSPYARQFLDRMDKPQVDRIDGIPPAIAIDQTNPVRTSRSTVGTMTELADHLKLLFARAARLFCRGCGREVRRDTPRTIAEDLPQGCTAMISFEVPIPRNFSRDEVVALLARQGYTRIVQEDAGRLEVLQDRVRVDDGNRERLLDSLEAALRQGGGRLCATTLDADRRPLATRGYSADLHCPDCDLHYREPVPSQFSFNSPLGACETCRGFGRTMGIDWRLVVPDHDRTLAGGAVKPFQSESYRECQDDLMAFAGKRGIPTGVAWRDLSTEQQRWVIEGEGSWEDKKWYGARRFFDWLETKSYRMHIRVLLSKYRSYDTCVACGGARLKPEALQWRLGSRGNADDVVESPLRFRPVGSTLSPTVLESLPGLTLHDVMRLPVDRCARFFDRVELPGPLDEASGLLLGEIRARLAYLQEVGLGYLTLDRQSRTLSGGEVQRINLTTALGTSLTNTLFVLDEPSVGLHPRDVRRVIGVLQRLREAGNSLLVVEHDPQLMLAADHLVDMGPGPGERGGRIVFAGSPRELIASGASLTAEYLRGTRQVAGPAARLPAPDAWIEVQGAAENNLKAIDVRIPLHRLVAVTGVSGSGKSTLIETVLHRALSALAGRPGEPAGRHRAIVGTENVRDVVLVDQSPIGRTTRSNPASYVGAFDAIRKLFADEPLARERKYTAGTFSFNAGNGRCPTCGGNGFEHVEMQFLSDVYIRCPDCDGSRYRAEVLEVRFAPAGAGPSTPPRSIAEVLEMTASEASAWFAGYPEVVRALDPLVAVGLGYLRLGQPVPTLSGGEAQRLKLAGHLADRRARHAERKGLLFLFDEPTTGLHFADVAVLLAALRRLIDAGHSVVVIEHNLDLMRAADWLIDLGPEGGEAGGELVFEGTPEEAMRHPGSHTGTALREDESARIRLRVGEARAEDASWSSPTSLQASARELAVDGAIRIHNAREHNLKGIDIRIPRHRFTVITGVSGSGKSTVAFDILFAEGQRRYLESLNAYARQFVQPAARADVDAIFGIPPTVAIEQRTSRGGRKSTVATVTEIYHFLRLLWVKLGTQQCPRCEVAIEQQTAESVVERIQRDYRGRGVQVLAPLVVNRKGYYTDLAKWAAGKGYGHLRVDGQATPTADWPRLARFREHNIELPVGTIRVSPAAQAQLRELVARAIEYGKGMVTVVAEGAANFAAETRRAVAPAVVDPPRSAAVPATRLFSTRRACPGCGTSFPELDPRLFSFNSRHGWCETCFGTGVELAGFDSEQTGEEAWWNASSDGEAPPCRACGGLRLNPTALAVRFAGLRISDVTAQSVEEAATFVRSLKLVGRNAEIARDILPELGARLAFLDEVGLGYLTLDRAAPTLSGGEAQRIRLAAQLGSNLRGVCYILDEPTIGLHPRDNQRLLATLGGLRAKGNTVVVVEHDEETIRRADHVIDLGPGAGVAGGRVVAEGPIAELLADPASVTGRCLAAPLAHPLRGARRAFRPRADAGECLVVEKASLHNLRDIRASFPLSRLICVTGVSGSGKSTLVREVLHDNLKAMLGARRRSAAKLRGCSAITGAESVGHVLEVDQTPIGKTPRSCPATYVGVWDHIRRLFAGTPDARMRGWSPARFSFNVAGGRCEACEGQGVLKVEMSFLPDVEVACDVCRGARFSADTLSIRFRDRSIGEVLAMPVEQAVDFFAAHRPIHHVLRLLQDVGLDYLTLGQPSPTLSGGEAQRIKLVTELAKARDEVTVDPAPGNVREQSPGKAAIAGPGDGGVNPKSRRSTLYVLDEPTIGLHMADVDKLIRVLHRLVDAGNTVVVVEHDLDLVAEADWVIDLGPEGGAAGGGIVAAGTPERIAASAHSHTGTVLRGFLAERLARPGEQVSARA